MIVSVVKVTGTVPNAVADGEFSNVFYSKLDPICWTNWDIGNVDKANTLFALAEIRSTTNKIPTYLNPDPIVYVMAATTNATTATSTLREAMQLLVFDGGHDEYQTAATVVNAPVEIYLKTKHFDGGNQYGIKVAKRGMLELYTSDTEHIVTTSWDIDSTTTVADEKRSELTQDYTVGLGSNLIQFKADFMYRRASFNLRTSLQTDTSQIKIKDVAIAQEVARAEFEKVR